MPQCWLSTYHRLFLAACRRPPLLYWSYSSFSDGSLSIWRRMVKRSPGAFATATNTGWPAVLLSARTTTLAERESGRFRPVKLPLSARSSGKSEAQVVVPVRRRVPVAVRRLAVGAVVVPAAAPVHPVRALGPPTATCCSTAVRNRQLETPALRANATNAVARCCKTAASMSPFAYERSRLLSFCRNRRRLRRDRILCCRYSRHPRKSIP